jgi:hypothetical protein
MVFDNGKAIMRTQARHIIVAGLFAGLSLSIGAIALGAESDWEASGPPPAAVPAFKAGDVVTVAPESANLMRGTEVVAVVAGGQRIVVVEVRGQWVGTYVAANGEKKDGWLRMSDFIPAGDSARADHRVPCQQCALQTVTAASSTPEAAVCRVRAEPTGSSYFRDYDAGYYGRHETDPNLTVWEPWMH